MSLNNLMRIKCWVVMPPKAGIQAFAAPLLDASFRWHDRDGGVQCLIRILLFALLCWACPVLATTIDTQLPLQIVADASLFDYKSGINTYDGHVKVDQGTSHLIANRVVTKNNAKHKIEEAIAYGSEDELAEYSTVPSDGGELLTGKARVIKYYPFKSTIILEGDVTVIQGENSFQGPLIIYNVKDQTVAAPSTNTGRATIVIEPGQMKS